MVLQSTDDPVDMRTPLLERIGKQRTDPLLVSLLFVFFLVIPIAKAQPEFVVISVHQELPLSNHDSSPKDLYINAGSSNGLKKGIYLDLLRRIPLYDRRVSKTQTDTWFPYARAQVIHVDHQYSIARIAETAPSEITPQSAYLGSAVGDRIQISKNQSSSTK